MAQQARYVCKLSPELIQRAHEELNEPTNDSERILAIDELKVAYNEDVYGKLLRRDDAFFLSFLRAKKFRQEKALKCLQNYHKVRVEYSEVFDKVDSPVLLKPYFDKHIMYYIPEKAKDGAAVMLYRPGLLDENVDMHDLMAYSVLSIEKALQDEAVQICGLRSIEDLNNFNMKIFLKVSVKDIARMNKIWTEAMPLRFKAAHLLNEGKVYDVLMAMMKPFMKQKLLDRILLHGSDYDTLHKYVDPSFLPPYLNGTGAEPEVAGKVWNDILREDWTHDTEL